MLCDVSFIGRWQIRCSSGHRVACARRTPDGDGTVAKGPLLELVCFAPSSKVGYKKNLYLLSRRHHTPTVPSKPNTQKQYASLWLLFHSSAVQRNRVLAAISSLAGEHFGAILKTQFSPFAPGATGACIRQTFFFCSHFPSSLQVSNEKTVNWPLLISSQNMTRGDRTPMRTVRCFPGSAFCGQTVFEETRQSWKQGLTSQFI